MNGLIVNFSSPNPMHRLQRAGDDRLTLEATMKVRVVAVGCGIAAALFLIGTGIQGLVYAAILAFGAIGCWYFPVRAVFDRGQGLATVRRFFHTRRIPLCDIEAIGIRYGGRHRLFRRTYFSKKLVLQMSEEEEFASICLTNHADDAVTLAFGQQLAEFLEVPLRNETLGGELARR
jgi:hypothetical protein